MLKVRQGAGPCRAEVWRGTAIGSVLVRILVVDDDPRSAGRSIARCDSRATRWRPILGRRALEASPRPTGRPRARPRPSRRRRAQVCRRMRGAGDDTPVLMLTARDAVNDRVQGLDAVPMTIWSSRSPWPSCWPVCERCCGAAPGRRRLSGWATSRSTWDPRGSPRGTTSR